MSNLGDQNEQPVTVSKKVSLYVPSYSLRGSQMNDVSRYLRSVTLEEALTSSKELRQSLQGKNLLQKKACIYPLWPYRFMSGPETWLIAAHSISPSTVWVGLILWQQWRLNRGKQPLKLTGSTLRKFGVSRISARRALVALEKTGLITIQRFQHRSPLVTIVTDR